MASSPPYGLRRIGSRSRTRGLGDRGPLFGLSEQGAARLRQCLNWQSRLLISAAHDTRGLANPTQAVLRGPYVEVPRRRCA